MIYSLRGVLIELQPKMAVVECGGVGYACAIPFSTYSQLGNIGGEVYLYTYMNVRQDGVDLFGFSTREELHSFKMLTTVTGVGAKAGLAILSDMTPESIALAVVSSDAKAFTKCSGVGAKLAARIVLELKDKFKNTDLSQSVSQMDKHATTVGNGAFSEAMAALVALGYTQSEAVSALTGMDNALSTEELIKGGLRVLATK